MMKAEFQASRLESQTPREKSKTMRYKNSSSLASHMKKNMCAGEVTDMKCRCRRAKCKVIMKCKELAWRSFQKLDK